MAIQRKLNLARYKKSIQGLIDFAILIEQADPVTREKIIQSTRSQDSEFLIQVMRRVVYFEELIYLDEGVVAEIMATVSPKLIAYSLFGMPDKFRTSVTNHLGFRGQKQVQDETDKMGGEPPEAMVQGAQRQILKIARDLEGKGKFVLEALASPRFTNKLKKTG